MDQSACKIAEANSEAQPKLRENPLQPETAADASSLGQEGEAIKDAIEGRRHPWRSIRPNGRYGGQVDHRPATHAFARRCDPLRVPSIDSDQRFEGNGNSSSHATRLACMQSAGNPSGDRPGYLITNSADFEFSWPERLPRLHRREHREAQLIPCRSPHPHL